MSTTILAPSKQIFMTKYVPLVNIIDRFLKFPLSIEIGQQFFVYGIGGSVGETLRFIAIRLNYININALLVGYIICQNITCPRGNSIYNN